MDEEKCRNISLDQDQRREVLQLLLKRYGSIRKLAEVLGVSKSSLHRIIKGEQSGALARIVDFKACLLLDEEELFAILKRRQILEATGLVREGKVNVPLLVAILDAVLDFEEAKHAVLELMAKRFKTELREVLGETLPKIELRWSEDFERWLTEKKSKPISERTLRDYRNLWSKCLEGKVLGWHLLKQLEGKKMLCHDNKYHPTSWARQIVRHYIRFLYSQGKLDWDTYSRLLLTIPGRKYGRKLAQKSIAKEDVVVSLKTLKENRPDIYLVYLLILYSAVRFEHVLNALKTWSPNDKLYLTYLQRDIKRLECLDTHCRYYLGKETDVKPVAFMFFPKELLPLIEEYRLKLPCKHRIYKVAVKKLHVMPAKFVRTFAMREMLSVLGDNDVTRFILGKFGELTVSARHYRYLLEEADKVYPKYVEHVNNLIEG